MKLVTFIRDYGGYLTGSSQYYTEEFADELIKRGLVRAAYPEPNPKVLEVVETMEPEEELETLEKQEEQNKAMDAPVKDKMLRMPRKKK